jgi:hypothetical protein
MNNKSKIALLAVVAFATIASPAFAQDATTVAYRHHHAHRPVNNDRQGYRANARVSPPNNPTGNPVDDPAMTGGGSMGYNACAGHPSC